LRGFDTNQVEFARSIGVAQSHISAVERGEKELGALPLLRIARHYGKTVGVALDRLGPSPLKRS
jgi:DNA-binding XRE family transcriptional regulator